MLLKYASLAAMVLFPHDPVVAQLVRVKLTDGVSVGIPADWLVRDSESNRRRFEEGKRVMDLAAVPSGPGGVLLTASPDGNPDRISVVISIMRRPTASQAEVATLQGADLDQVNQQFKEDLLAGMRAEGASLLEWRARCSFVHEKIPPITIGHRVRNAWRSSALIRSSLRER